MLITKLANDIHSIIDFIPKPLCSELITSFMSFDFTNPDDNNPYSVVTDLYDKQIPHLKEVSESILDLVLELYPQHIVSNEVDLKNLMFKVQLPGQDHYPHNDSELYDDPSQLGRTISGTLLLNDNYEGGHFLFPNHNIVLKPSAGTLLLWPSKDCWHGVDFVTGDIPRFSLLSWWYLA